MPPFTISPCMASDGPAIGRSNLAAFWTDPTWVLMWPGQTREYMAEQAARRMAHNLLMDRAHRRHLKAVDAASGVVVGYARWDLPRGDACVDAEADDACNSLWPEAQVPAVSEEERAEAEREYKAAWWAFDRSLDELDPPMLEMKDRHMERKRYMLLDYLAVHPDSRGKGVGTILVETGAKEADKIGIESCALGMRAGLSVYKRVGFKLVEEVIQDASKFGGEKEYGAYFLVRGAAKSSV